MADKIYTFCLPDIGEGVVEGEVVEWLKKEGDIVAQDEPVVIVMTDKATVELPAPYPGTVLKQYYKPGEVAIKDKPLYDLEVDAGIRTHAAKHQLAAAPSQKTEAQRMPEPRRAAPDAVPRCGKALAVPSVRRMASEWGIDLEGVAGTGKGGRVTEEDLHRSRAPHAAAVPHPLLEGDQEQPLTGVRGAMARRMDKRHVPQFSFFEQAEAARLIEMRGKFKDKADQEGIRLSFMPFLIRALSLTMRAVPLVNASVDMRAGKVILHRAQHVGIAMAAEQGLIVPVLKDVEKMGLNEIIRGYDQLKRRALAGKLPQAEMKGATITISNFGAVEGEGLWATPMISEPEAAILAIARMRKVPLVKNGQVVVRDVLPLSWSFDHRVIDGELAAHISHTFAGLLRDPARLL